MTIRQNVDMQKTDMGGARLKALRESIPGLTLQKMADELGVPKTTYASREEKMKSLRSEFIEEVASIFEKYGVQRTDTWRVLAMPGNHDVSAEFRDRSLADLEAERDDLTVKMSFEMAKWTEDLVRSGKLSKPLNPFLLHLAINATYAALEKDFDLHEVFEAVQRTHKWLEDEMAAGRKPSMGAISNFVRHVMGWSSSSDV